MHWATQILNNTQHQSIDSPYCTLFVWLLTSNTTSKKLDEKLLLEEIFVSSIDNNFVYVDSFLRDS